MNVTRIVPRSTSDLTTYFANSKYLKTSIYLLSNINSSTQEQIRLQLFQSSKISSNRIIYNIRLSSRNLSMNLPTTSPKTRGRSQPRCTISAPPTSNLNDLRFGEPLIPTYIPGWAGKLHTSESRKAQHRHSSTHSAHIKRAPLRTRAGKRSHADTCRRRRRPRALLQPIGRGQARGNRLNAAPLRPWGQQETQQRRAARCGQWGAARPRLVRSPRRRPSARAAGWC